MGSSVGSAGEAAAAAAVGAALVTEASPKVRFRQSCTGHSWAQGHMSSSVKPIWIWQPWAANQAGTGHFQEPSLLPTGAIRQINRVGIWWRRAQKDPFSLISVPVEISPVVVLRCCRAQSPAAAGVTELAMSELSSQPDLLTAEGPVQVTGSIWCLCEAGADHEFCWRCAVVEKLCQQERELRRKRISYILFEWISKRVTGYFQRSYKLKALRSQPSLWWRSRWT